MKHRNAPCRLRRRLLPLFALLLLLPAMQGAALSGGESYLYDTKGRSIPAPDPYTVAGVYNGARLGVGRLNKPADLFVDKEQNLYIADAGNNRIVVVDKEFRPVRTISQVKEGDRSTGLSNPQGVFAAGGLVYICDTGHARILAVNERDEVTRTMTGEEIVAVNKNIVFTPSKVAVDTEGNVFVVDTAIYQGILQYDGQDDFIGFFAPNEVKVTADVLFLQMWKSLFNSEQREELEKTLPSPYNNLYIDGENFVYATSGDVSAGNDIKRLNSLGVNILQPPDRAFGGGRFGDLESSYEDYKEVKSRFVDVHADEAGLICGADGTRSRLFLYDGEANLVAIFGGAGDRENRFGELVAIEKMGDRYIALDAAKGRITVFEPTAYLQQVLEALAYYNQGLYIQSVDRWQAILEENSHFTIAYRSIGRAYLQEGKSAEAMTMLKKGDDRYFYSLALKEYRKEYVRRYFLPLLFGVIAVLVGLILLVRYARRWILSKKGA